MDEERQHRVKWIKLASVPDITLPQIGFAAEIIKTVPGAQTHVLLPGAPFWKESDAKAWVEERVRFQVRLKIPITCLTGFVRCGQVIARSRDVLAVNTDAPLTVWTYSLAVDSMAWSEVLLEASE